LLQTWQALPFTPHAEVVFAGLMQLPLGVQQPLQLAAEHPVPPWQTPPTQLWVLPQTWQAPPPAPQAWMVFAGERQTPVLVQQPLAQLDALQVCCW